MNKENPYKDPHWNDDGTTSGMEAQIWDEGYEDGYGGGFEDGQKYGLKFALNWLSLQSCYGNKIYTDLSTYLKEKGMI